MIPPFDSEGFLPPGVHSATWQEFELRFGGTPHRQRLLLGLRRALECLRAAGCRLVFIDGSFVTSKDVPGDFDACWDIDHVDVSKLDPVLLQFGNRRAAQKTKYFGELFPAQVQDTITGLTFIEFFQLDKDTGRPKGIVALDFGRL